MESILSLNGDDGNNTEDSDGGSLDGEYEGENEINEEDEMENNRMEDDLEEGECSSPVIPQSDPVGGCHPLPVDRKSPENDSPGEVGQSEHVKFPGVGESVRDPTPVSQEVHGDGSMHEDNNGMGNDNMVAEVSGGGPQILEERENVLLDKNNVVGLSPAFGLGKRSREVRSPPSTGSMQGPPMRNFNHDFESGDTSFDLNRPVSSPRCSVSRKSVDKDNSGSRSPQVESNQRLSDERLHKVQSGSSYGFGRIEGRYQSEWFRGSN
ncbi:hypothetical protein Hanom_Chr05g00405091 [Helianthus anomalus]